MNDEELFFANPQVELKDASNGLNFEGVSANKFGLLYLLRRDINACLPSSNNTPSQTIAWLGAIGIFAAIDLLSQHMAGTNKDDRTLASIKENPDHWKHAGNQRFQKFIVEHFKLNENHAEIIYQLRCSLAHSYAVIQENVVLKSDKEAGAQTLEFLLTDQPGETIVSRVPDGGPYIINLFALHDGLENSIERYKQSLTEPINQESFRTMFNQIGSACIYPAQSGIEDHNVLGSTLNSCASGVSLNAYLPQILATTSMTFAPNAATSSTSETP